MTEIFDAYHKWLGIPPADQPPDYYRLLGVRRFESDLDVIEHAADQRMSHIRSFQGGPHAEQSHRLLNELSSARRNLLDSEWKAKHDEAIRAPLKVQEPGVAVSPPPPGQLSLPGTSGQTPSEIPCPACGGLLPGEYRKCMHCRSELTWENGMPLELMEEVQPVTATLVSERNEGEELRYSDIPPQLRPDKQQMEEIEEIRMNRIRTRMAKQLSTKFRDDTSNGQTTSLVVGVCLVFGFLYWARPSSSLLAILFGVSFVATIAYLASRHRFRP
jgi:hypothetical protein